MEYEFQNKVVLVTGAGAGLGRAISQAFSAEGAFVICADVDRQQGLDTVAILEKAGGRGSFHQTDVSNEESIVTLFDAIINNYGALDVAINNAGIEIENGKDLGNWDIPVMRRVWEINVMGVFLCMKKELEIMQRQGHGAITNMSSVAGVVGASGKPAYTASKHAVIGLTKSAAVQYGPMGIRVNAICPSVTRTRMYDVQDIPEEVMIQAHPLRRIADPSDVAEAALWLSSSRSRNVTGHSLLVDGGYMAY